MDERGTDSVAGSFSEPATQIAAYKIQLQKVNETLSFIDNNCGDASAGHECTRTELMELKSSIEELIALIGSEPTAPINYPRSLDEDSSNDDTPHVDTSDNSEDSEVGSDAQDSSNEDAIGDDASNNLEEEFDVEKEFSTIMGSKCQAPYTDATLIYKTYYNALVVSAVPPTKRIRSLMELKVKVMFANPITKAMVPCPFYLNGDCKFEDDKCHYSHGEIVSYSELKEYREPNFEQVKPKSIVLVKQDDGIWYRGLVTEVTEQNECIVKLESGGGKRDKVLLQDVLLLGEIKGIGSSSYLGGIDEDEEMQKSSVLERSLLSEPIGRKLGEWEKYTKNIGSRIMMNMGYVTGTGLGKNSDGLVEPIPAVICPAGKSLDYCMNLREKATPFFYQEHDTQERVPFNKEKEKPNSGTKNNVRRSKDVFSFMNSVLRQHGNNAKKVTERFSKSFKSSTSQQLNVEKLKVSEDIRKKEKDMFSLRLSVMRSAEGSICHSIAQKKLSAVRVELIALQQRDNDITKEQLSRDTKKKMTEF